MCLSTIYTTSAEGNSKVMKDVAKLEAEDDGFWMIDLLGERKFVRGSIKSIDLIDSFVLIDPEGKRAEFPSPAAV